MFKSISDPKNDQLAVLFLQKIFFLTILFFFVICSYFEPPEKDTM
jgi:hypothetical protein